MHHKKSGAFLHCHYMYDIHTGSNRHVDVFVKEKKSHVEKHSRFSSGNIGIGLYRYFGGKKIPAPSKMEIDDEKHYYCIERTWLTLDEIKGLQSKLAEIINFVETL